MYLVQCQATRCSSKEETNCTVVRSFHRRQTRSEIESCREERRNWSTRGGRGCGYCAGCGGYCGACPGGPEHGAAGSYHSVCPSVHDGRGRSSDDRSDGQTSRRPG